MLPTVIVDSLCDTNYSSAQCTDLTRYGVGASREGEGGGPRAMDGIQA
jgi:hypothetical protein